MPTPLTNTLDATLLRMDYCGVHTFANFGSVADEVATLRSGSAIHDLGWLAFIKVTGEDRVRWLNGMVTNNTRDLEPDHGNYNFILTTQGRIVGDLTAYQRGDHYLMVTSESQREHLLGALNKYIIMDDVELTDISSLMTALGITGPKAKDFCATAGLPSVKLNELQQVQWNGIDITFTQSAESPVPIFQIWLHPDNVNTTWQKLLAAGAKPAGSEAIEKFRILCGIPMYGKDIREKELPQETMQEQALNFTKGCYVGQEIVERIRSRGIVHRGLTGFILDKENTEITLPASGENLKIQHEGKDMGYVTSFARVPVNGEEKLLALGYLRREAATPGNSVKILEVHATVAALPFRF